MMRGHQAAWLGVGVAALLASLETPVRALCMSLSPTYVVGGPLTCGVDCWVVLPVDGGTVPTIEDLMVIRTDGGHTSVMRPVRVLSETQQGTAVLYHADGPLMTGDWTVSNGYSLRVLPQGEATGARILAAADEPTAEACNDTQSFLEANRRAPVPQNRPLLPKVTVGFGPTLPDDAKVAWTVWVQPADAPAIRRGTGADALPEPRPNWERVHSPDGYRDRLLLADPSMPEVSGGERFRVCLLPHFPDGQTGELLCTVIQAQQADEGPGCAQANAAPLGLTVIALSTLRARRRPFSRAS